MKRKIPLLRPILNASEPEGSTCTTLARRKAQKATDDYGEMPENLPNGV